MDEGTKCAASRPDRTSLALGSPVTGWLALTLCALLGNLAAVLRDFLNRWCLLPQCECLPLDGSPGLASDILKS